MCSKKSRKIRKSSILCWLLAVAVLMTGIPVSAADFSDSAGGSTEVFSSGAAGDTYAEPSSAVSAADSTQEIVTLPEDAEEGEAVSQGTDDGADSGLEIFEESGETTVLGEDILSGGETDVSAAALKEGDAVTVRFADETGGTFYADLQMDAIIGGKITLPYVPGREDSEDSGWKTDPEMTEAVLYGGDILTLSPTEDWITENMEDGVLTLYAVPGKDMCTVYFYNNSGTAVFSGGKLTVAAGGSITLPDFQNSNYINYGWTASAGSATVKYKIGAKLTVTKDLKLYIVRLRKLTVNFYGPTGSSTSTYRALAQTTGKGKTITLPAVPSVYGYQNLGWSTKANATTAVYSAGQSIKVTKDLKLYAVRRKLTTYKVYFTNNSGTSTSKSYTSLNTRIVKNTYITLPAVPKRTGYQSVGWTTTKGGTTPVYKAGSKVKITKATRFYAVYKKSKYYTVEFLLGDGSTNSTYKKLAMRVEQGTVITFPSVPARSGYVNLGWSGTKGASTASKVAGNTGTVKRNYTFYAVQKQAVQVILCKNNREEYRTVTMGKGDSLVLPSVANSSGYTFMGWSRTAYQSKNPTYEAGDTIKVSYTIRLYAVVFNRTAEPNLGSVSKLNTDKYSRLIFVGDSRTDYMSNALAELGSAENVSYVARAGAGLSWFKSEGYSKLLSMIGTGGSAAKPVAVIFNWGVNDLANASSYVTYMNQIAQELTSRGCKLFYMSVNPVNSKMNAATGHTVRNEADVRSFNSTIYSGLCSTGKYTYINMYSYLMKNGFGTDAGTGRDTGVDDGLHYTEKTYRRIYQYCMSVVNNA